MDESELIGIDDMPAKFQVDSLLQAYPNPFNAQVKIKFAFHKSDVPRNMTFKIYNLLGQVVRNFQPQAEADQKNYEFTWDGRNDNGIIVTSGNYFFVATTPQQRHVLKLLFMK